MKNLFKKNKAKKGFTLIELIITLSILTIVMGMILGALSPIFRSYGDGSTYVEASDMAKTVAKYVRNSAKTGKEVYLSDTDEKTYYPISGTGTPLANAIFVQDGKLYRRDSFSGTAEEVYESTYFDKYELSMTLVANRIEITAVVVGIEIEMIDRKSGEVAARHIENFETVNASQIWVNSEATGKISCIMFNLPAPEGVPDKDYNAVPDEE